MNIADWYWIVGGSTTNVYSSRRNIYVPIADVDYVAWNVPPNVATPIATEADFWYALQDVLPAWLFDGTAFSQPAVGQYTKAQLVGYSADARWRHRNAGVVITSLSAVAFMSDDASVNDINSSYNYGQANPAATFSWKMSDNSFVALDATKITTLHNDVLNFVQKCFDCENTTRGGINSGSVTTLAAIDAAYAAIVNVYP